MVFAFKHNGPSIDPALLQALHAKKYESCVQGDGLNYSVLYLFDKKRVSWFKSVLIFWNNGQISDEAKIQLDGKIATFSRRPGDTHEDNSIVQTIRTEMMLGEISTYKCWECNGPCPKRVRLHPQVTEFITETSLVPYIPPTHPLEDETLSAFVLRNVIEFSRSQISLDEESWEMAEQKEIEDARGSEYRVGGFVYAASNPFFGTLVKIGATTKTPLERLKALSRTSVPEPFAMVAYIEAMEPFQLERQIHRHFSARRKYGRKNEFFDVPAMEIFHFFQMLRRQQVSGFPAKKFRRC